MKILPLWEGPEEAVLDAFCAGRLSSVGYSSGSCSDIVMPMTVRHWETTGLVGFERGIVEMCPMGVSSDWEVVLMAVALLLLLPLWRQLPQLPSGQRREVSWMAPCTGVGFGGYQ